MIDDRATIEHSRHCDNAVQSYVVGEAVMLDGDLRVPMVVRVGSDALDERYAFTVAQDGGVPKIPARAPSHALHVPSHLSVSDALLLSACWPKVYMALVHRLKVGPRDTVLIYDAHTAAGTLALLIANSLDAVVLAVCDTAGHAQRAIALGAAEATTITSAWPEVMREHGGADVVLDFGGAHAGASTLCARRHARIGVMDGTPPMSFNDAQWQRFFLKQLTLIAVDWSPLRDAPIALEAAASFKAITRTDAWARYAVTRDTPDKTGNGAGT